MKEKTKERVETILMFIITNRLQAEGVVSDCTRMEVKVS